MSAPELEYPHLVEELRLAGPPPSDELRERVRALGARPQRRPRRRLKLLAVAMPVAAVLAALALGTLEGARDSQVVYGEVGAASAPPPTAKAQPWELQEAGAPSAARAFDEVDAGVTVERVTALPPNRTRAQQYRADLVVHVDSLEALSLATSNAMQLTRNMGGYLLSATQDTSADGRGYSSLVVRVPTQKVQRAIVRFAQLGTILEQQVHVQDVQRTLDKLFREAQALRAQIAKLEAEPQTPERDAKLRILRLRLDELTGRSERIAQRASFARIALTLTTEETAAITPVPDEPGRLERAWERSLDILVGEAVVLLYVVLVGGPFVVLAALVWLSARTGRRRSREALLERS